jgi:Kelch motif/Galactose oxidase, central domain
MHEKRWSCSYAEANLRFLQQILPRCLLDESVQPFLVFEKPISDVILIFGGRHGDVKNPKFQSCQVLAIENFSPKTAYPIGRMLSPLYLPRVGATAIFYPPERYLLIGGCTGSTTLSNIDCLSIKDGSWHKNYAEMLAPRYGHATLLIDHRYLFIFGGETPTGDQKGSCEMHDLLKRTTHSMAKMPLPVAGARAFFSNDKIFLLGGVHTFQSKGGCNKIQVYDIKNQDWSILPTIVLKTPRSSYALHETEKSGTVMLSGGFQVTETGEETEISSIEYVDLFHEAASSAIDAIPESLPSPRGGCMGLTVCGKKVIVGGEQSSVLLANDLTFPSSVIKDTALLMKTDTWEKSSSPFLCKTAFACTVGDLWPDEYYNALPVVD